MRAGAREYALTVLVVLLVGCAVVLAADGFLSFLQYSFGAIR